MPAEAIRTAGTDGADRSDELGHHGRHRVRDRPACQRMRVHGVERLLGREAAGQDPGVEPAAAVVAVEEEERGLGAARAHGDDQVRADGLLALHRGRQPGHGRRREERGERQPTAHFRLESMHELHGEQGVAAELEKIVEDANPRHREQRAPDDGNLPLEWVARLDVCGRLPRLVGRGQGPAVELAVRPEGQRGQGHERGGHHVLGQRAPEDCAEICGRRRGALSGNDVCDEPRIGSSRRPRDHRSLADAGAIAQPRLHLAGLHAVAADLHLIVHPTEELQHPVRAPAPAITRAVHPRTRLRVERIGEKALGGEVRAAEISARHAGPADVELPGHSDRGRLPGEVEHVDAGIRHGPPDQGGFPPLVGGPYPMERGGHRALGGAVLVHHFARRAQGRARIVDVGQQERLARAQHQPERGGRTAGVAGCRAQRAEHGGHHREQRGHPMLVQPAHHGAPVANVGVVEEHQARPRRQPTEDLAHRGVEADAGDRQDDVGGPQGKLPDQIGEIVDDTSVRREDAVRPAGRARCIGGVGHVVRSSADLGALHRVTGPGGRVVERDALDALEGQPRPHTFVNEHETGSRIREHEAQPILGIVRVQRQVGRAGLQHSEQRRHQRGRSLCAHPDERAWTHTSATQEAGQPGRRRVELRVGHAGGSGHDGHRVRRARHLRLDEARDGRRLRRWSYGAIPSVQHLPSLRFARESERGQAGVRGRDHGGKQPLEVLEQPGDRARLVELRAVAGGHVEALGHLGGVHRHVELRALAAHGEALDREPAQGRQGGAGIPQAEHYLDDRVSIQGALRRQLLDQLLEGHVLMAVPRQCDLAHPAQVLAHGGIAREIAPQRQRADEEADERLDLDAGAARDR